MISINVILFSLSNRRDTASQVERPAASSTGGFDLLGNILMGQSLLHLKGDEVTIRRDGKSSGHACHLVLSDLAEGYLMLKM